MYPTGSRVRQDAATARQRPPSAQTAQHLTPPDPPPQASPKMPSVGYQSGINAERPAINASSVVDRSQREGRAAKVTSGAAKDFLRGQQSEDAANLRRGIAQENAQQNMVEQANRSELFQAGLAQQVDMFNKMAQHRTNQAGLAADIMQQLMRSREALMQSLMQ